MSLPSTQPRDDRRPSQETAELSTPTTPPGLSTEEAAQRLSQYGPNEFVEHAVSPLRQLLGYFYRPFFAAPYPAPILLGAIVATQSIAVLTAAFGWLITPIPWSYIGWVVLYALTWMLVADGIKLLVYRGLHRDTVRHRRFLTTLKTSFHPHGKPH